VYVEGNRYLSGELQSILDNIVGNNVQLLLLLALLRHECHDMIEHFESWHDQGHISKAFTGQMRFENVFWSNLRIVSVEDWTCVQVKSGSSLLR
jgi:hypothetical protein